MMATAPREVAPSVSLDALDMVSASRLPLNGSTAAGRGQLVVSSAPPLAEVLMDRRLLKSLGSEAWRALSQYVPRRSSFYKTGLDRYCDRLWYDGVCAVEM